MPASPSPPTVAVGDGRLPPRPFRVLVIGSGAAVLFAVLSAAALSTGLTMADAVADPQETTGYRFLGIVSNVGILFWGATVAIAAFAAVVVEPTTGESREWRRFLMASAAIALLLLIDDFLLVHEFGDDVARWFVDFEATTGRKNVIESAIFAGYGLVVLTYGRRFRRQFRRLDLRPLAAAAVLLAVSYAVDIRLHRLVGITLSDGSDGPDLRSILEEGPKFVGIVLLVVFIGRAARQAIAESACGGTGSTAPEGSLPAATATEPPRS
ncbi:MAG: hypothetical protein AAFN30_05155 [Actinomycetota bacterium]